MNKFIKDVIEEKFASKKQQGFFYVQASKKGKEGKKWSKWAKEFSSKTDFENLPDEVEKKEVEEIVDKKGNIKRGKKPRNFNSKGITQKKTTDLVVKAAAGSMGTHGVHGTHTSLRYWAEADMSKALGYEDTLGQDADYKDAEKHFEKELNLDDEEVKKRMDQMGYDEDLEGDQVRLIENPKKFMEEYIESLISKNNRKESEIIPKGGEKKEINPIINKQLTYIKDSNKNNGLSVDDILEYLKDNE
jgi:hypothetical protein